ncbi:MAG: hypothetical protein A2X77_05330 [Gammaproteobacteria bacterium GWE2_42_36]|nr:MAG: hypothetical protein A2X77_05330 [Gammaproteobacteria bacterium GWE2_42_36]
MNNMDKKVLVVDDEPISLMELRRYLEEACISFEQAQNGQEALSKLKEHPDRFCAVVIDRYMPYMSGLEVLLAMQQSKQLKKIPVIMLTGLSEKEDIIETIRAGVFDYLVKPVTKDLLMPLLNRAIDIFGGLSSSHQGASL